MTENTENILSEGKWGERGLGNKGAGSQGRFREKGEDQGRGGVDRKEWRLGRMQCCGVRRAGAKGAGPRQWVESPVWAGQVKRGVARAEGRIPQCQKGAGPPER